MQAHRVEGIQAPGDGRAGSRPRGQCGEVRRNGVQEIGSATQQPAHGSVITLPQVVGETPGGGHPSYVTPVGVSGLALDFAHP